ncbi:MAG: RluA family pseudouridine synthase [Deltaproteobacteria bacterium]|nr:RluA family pseudouridine synthase [Deltaproteobacteria bacterium]
MRLDRAVVEALADLSRMHVQRLIKEGLVTVDGAPSKPAFRLEGGERIEVRIPPPPPVAVTPEAIPLRVLYEDESLAAIDKAAGMVVHPGHGNREGTLVNALLARWPQVADVGGRDRAGIVHRLDKETSGVILIAKTEPARLALMKQFAARTVEKRYLALVHGRPETAQGRIDAPIGRNPKQRKLMAVMREGRAAVTTFRVLRGYDAYTLVEATPQTGRTHQIRVHLAFINCPIVGDPVYGRRRQRLGLKRQFLHAAALAFTSPATGARVVVEAPLPPDLQAVLDALEPDR